MNVFLRGSVKMFENKQGISAIVFDRAIRLFCPLGKDMYQATIKVAVIPGEFLFDFCEVDRKIKALSSESLIAEDVAVRVYQIMQEYKPLQTTVSVFAESNTHFPVTIIKTDKEGNSNEKNRQQSHRY